jgi:aspartate/methionine/tyrosine aminotransferase
MKILLKKISVFLLIFIAIIIISYLFFYIFNKIQRKEEIKKETIISSIGEPYFIENAISPLRVELTPDILGKNGGLSYLSNNTDKLNVQMINDLFKTEYNIVLPEDTQIVFGVGSTMMITALYYALEKKLQKNITVTTNSSVYYTLHEKLTKIIKNVEWVQPTEDGFFSHVDLAAIVSPSNPLGVITSPKQIQQPYVLYDLVYDKAQFTGVFKTVNPEVYEEFAKNKKIYITNSFSKVGIAGARCGFLLTRDKEIADYCKEYVEISCLKNSTSSLTICRAAFYKHYIHRDWHIKNNKIINKRRSEFIKMSKKHNIKIFNENTVIPFMYTDKSVDWWLKKFNVETRGGSDFNDTDDNSRFNLMIDEEYWSEFMKRFQ